MSRLGASAGWGLLVAASLLAGAVVASVLRLSQRHSSVAAAFGGGMLLAAVAVELVPEADQLAGPGLTAAGLLAGALLFVGADAVLTRTEVGRDMRRRRHAAAAGHAMREGMSERAAQGEAMAVGLFIDGVPESVALGLTVAEGAVGAALLAGILIGNLVEAYGSATFAIGGGRSRFFAVSLLAGIGLALGLSTVIGGTLLADAGPSFMGISQAVAAGAVLAVVSLTIIPPTFRQVGSLEAVALVLGFIAGYLLS